MRGKLWWSNIAVGIHPGEFTLTEARDTYRAITGIEYDPSTFAHLTQGILDWVASALHQSLTRLTFAVSSPGTELPAARVLAEKLGTFVQHATIPYGPLGYLLFGFRVDKVSDP